MEHAEHIERELEEWRELLAGLGEPPDCRASDLVRTDTIKGGYGRKD